MDDELWWCSFADEQRFRGLVLIPREQAEDIVALARRLWMLGLNPGGSLMAVPASFEEIEESGESWQLDPANQGRLIDKAELTRRGYVAAHEANPQGFDREGFEADMASKMLEQEERDGAA